MTFDVVLFLGSVAMLPETVKDMAAQGFRPVPSLVRYADDDMESPSCCDWLVPGTIDIE